MNRSNQPTTQKIRKWDNFGNSNGGSSKRYTSTRFRFHPFSSSSSKKDYVTVEYLTQITPIKTATNDNYDNNPTTKMTTNDNAMATPRRTDAGSHASTTETRVDVALIITRDTSLSTLRRKIRRLRLVGARIRRELRSAATTILVDFYQRRERK